MEHGDLTAQFTLAAEPSRLLRHWRASLRDTRPESAGVTIVKRNRGWLDRSSDFHLAAVGRTERKLADMSLSALSLQLTSDEIERASRLHDILWAWLSRGAVPVLDEEMPYVRVGATLSGPADAVVTQIEGLSDTELLGSEQFLVHILEGRPPKLEARTPMAMRTSADFGPMMQGVADYAHMMAVGQEDALRALGQRLARVFRRRGDERRRRLQRLAREVLGDKADMWMTSPDRGRPAPVSSVEDYAYGWNMEWLERQRQHNGRPRRESAWRSTNP